MEIERALAIKEVAQVIVNTAKVEIDQRKLTNQLGTAFIPERPVDRITPAAIGSPPSNSGVQTIATLNGVKTIARRADGVTVTRHKMGG